MGVEKWTVGVNQYFIWILAFANIFFATKCSKTDDDDDDTPERLCVSVVQMAEYKTHACRHTDTKRHQI